MKIVVAADSFKGSLSSAAVAEHIGAGIRRVLPEAEIIKLPVADGGEGTVEALVRGAEGELCTAIVTGPTGEPTTATYGILKNGTAVIEMAAAAGLPLVPEGERNPAKTTTYGVGELMLTALDKGCKKMIIGLGGSATNDGGAGMAQALGVSFRDDLGKELPHGGGALAQLAAIDIGGLDKRIGETEILLASDVRSPLCGPEGASHVFAPQKGADGEMVRELDGALRHLSDVVGAQLGLDRSEAPGAGAAGGLGYGLMAFCGAAMQSGIETILDSVDFDRHLTGCDLVITGEGRIDAQSVFGKVPVGIAARAKKYGLPVLAVVGSMGDGADAVYRYGVDAIMCIVNRPMPLSEAMAGGGALLEDATERAMRMIQIGRMGSNC